uniref:Agmatine deiminase family protein n=1 Tax=Roseihalotalea indica TaxID=2867963 RepID=A0AA49PYR9_9BACT|nr:agmatine deiminase family protein [Tunicatimonas sp. TK19036]
MKNTRVFPAEWYPQSGVQLTWPHPETDWRDMLDQVIPCYQRIAQEVAKRQKLLVVCHNQAEVQNYLTQCDPANVIYYEIPTNDTWARDHSGITVMEDEQPLLLDFQFNGWGLKFPANYDNQITAQLYQKKAFQNLVQYQSLKTFVLEGGSLESDGEGTLLTTEECLLSHNRNEHLTKDEITTFLKETLGVQRVLWLKNGYLAGDDTDSHIDTLARFCDAQTIAYVQCPQADDEHYEALAKMEQELRQLRMASGEPYRLLPLPMADAVYGSEGERLPATYANFLILNEAVLLPFYGLPQDEPAREVLQEAFPNREIIGVPCEALIQQHGSLHCVTMQYPQGVLA